MRTSQRAAGIAVSSMIVGFLLLGTAAAPLHAASASAMVSATVLGPAETEIASGAVTVSNLSRKTVSVVGASVRSDIRDLAVFQVGGGFHAAYAVTLPESVTVTGPESALAVSGFRTGVQAGRLAADGTGRFSVSARVTIPAGQPAGAYSGSYPVTVAYN